MTHVLVARMDSLGDVLLSGPLIRAVAAGSTQLTYLCSPRGAEAAALLPGVDDVVVARAGWIEADPPAVTRQGAEDLVDRIGSLRVDEAIILTSFHQSPLPLALLLRMAGVARIGATSVDYPGTLLDVRCQRDDDIHEVARSLRLGEAMGYRLPPGDDGRLRVELPVRRLPALPGRYVVVHPGASVPARAWAPERHEALVALLAGRGRHVVVTGAPHERALTAAVAGAVAVDLGGALDLAGLAAVVAGADAIVVGNTGPAHLAAAMATPVVSIFAPTVPADRWRPWRVPHVLVGCQTISCAGCRARACPVVGHPCVDAVAPATVAAALDNLAGPVPDPRAVTFPGTGGGSQ